MQQPRATGLRCDPTEYARKQQEKRDRAKDLRDQRQRGVCSDDHTFAPKVNARVPASPASSREEPETSSQQPHSFDDTPIRPSKSSMLAARKEQALEDAPLRPAKRQPAAAAGRASSSQHHNNNNHADGEEEASAPDALDALSRRYPKKAPSRASQADDYEPGPIEPEHDSLFREVKRATGKELDDLPIKRSAGPAPGKHVGPCLRNSSCGCPQCSGGSAPASASYGGGGSGMRAEPLVRRRQTRATTPADDDGYSQPSSSARSSGMNSEMENSLTLLKSKMSRRKSRSAPTNPSASLFVDKNPPVNSARLPPSSTFASSGPQRNGQIPPARANQATTRPPPEQAPPPQRRAPPPAAAPARKRPPVQNDDEEEDDKGHYPPPISSGFNNDSNMTEYAEEEDDLVQCSICNRRFNPTVLEKHEKICAKSSGPRKVFNMTAKRLEGTEAEKIAAKAAKTAKAPGGGSKKGASASEQPIKSKAADWKAKSSMFRDAMKASRDVTKALKEGKELPPMAPSAPDPSLIQCEFCSRRFNDKAAERHIAFCREKSQRDTISKGPGKKAPPPKPARAPAKKR